MRFRRLAAVGVALATAFGASMLAATPASADGYCGKVLTGGWSEVKKNADGSAWHPMYPMSWGGSVDTAAEVVLWAKRSGDGADLLIQFRNLRANSKSGVIGKVGRSQDAQDLGITGTIGAAPDGAWCSSVVHAPSSTGTYIYSSLLYYVNGVPFGAGLDGLIRVYYA
jgi:hypothetical protein